MNYQGRPTIPDTVLGDPVLVLVIDQDQARGIHGGISWEVATRSVKDGNGKMVSVMVTR